MLCWCSIYVITRLTDGLVCFFTFCGAFLGVHVCTEGGNVCIYVVVVVVAVVVQSCGVTGCCVTRVTHYYTRLS